MLKIICQEKAPETDLIADFRCLFLIIPWY